MDFNVKSTPTWGAKMHSFLEAFTKQCFPTLALLLALISSYNTKAQCTTDVLKGQNLVRNFDFSQDYAEWTRSATYNIMTGGASGPGTILVGTDGRQFNGAFLSYPDHSPSADGKFLMVDGACTNNVVLWSQDNIPITPNTAYYFSVWVSTLKNALTNPGTFQLRINGVNVGTSYTAATNNGGVWELYERQWTSPVNAPAFATIEVLTVSGANCGSELDFAIDDISFIAGCSYAAAGPQPDLGADLTICGTTGILDLTATLPIAVDAQTSITWSVGATPDPSNKLKAKVSAPGLYAICVSQGGSCIKSDVLEVKNEFLVDIKDQVLCSPASTTLNAGFSGPNVTYKWYKDNVLIADAKSQNYFVNAEGSYRIEVSDNGGLCPTKSDVAIISTKAIAKPVNATFCNDGNVSLSVTPAGTQYDWYTTATGNTLATPSTGTATNTSTFVYTQTGTAESVFYVQDKAKQTSFVGPADLTGMTGGNNDGAIGVRFSAQAGFDIQGLTIAPFIYNAGPYTATFELLNAANQVIQTVSSTPINITTTQQNMPFIGYPITFATPITVPSAGNYTLRPTSGLPRFGPATWATYFVPDLMNFTGNTRNDHPEYYPGFYNWKLSSSTLCARIPVRATHECPPCQRPGAVSFASSIPSPVAGKPKTITVCSGTGTLATLNGTITTSTTAKLGYNYAIFKQGTVPVYTAGTNVAAKLLTAADQGVWILRAEDGTAGTAACYRQDTVELKISTLPSAPTATSLISYCIGASNATAVTASVTPGSGNVLTWYDAAINGNVLTTPAQLTPSTAVSGSPAISYWVSQKTNATPSCEGPRKQVDVNINALPNVQANASKTSINPGESVTLFGSGAIGYVWNNSVTNNIAFSPTVSNVYTVTGTDGNGCKNSASIVVGIKTSPKTICFGDSVTIKTTATSGTFQGWTPIAGLKQPANTSTIAKPTVTTTYLGTTLFSAGNNLFPNGDFTGTTAASIQPFSQYTNGSVPVEGNYTITTNPINVVGNFGNFTDHTSGTGNMMVVNGGANNTRYILRHTIAVTANTNYNFSAWVATCGTASPAGNPAIMRFEINGTRIGTPFNASSTVQVWNQFSATWNSGANTSAVISIFDENANGSGNDFALDDISFTSTIANISYTDSVKVIVNNLPIVTATANKPTICIGDSVILSGGGASTYTWDNGIIDKKTFKPTQTLTYTVTGTDANACKNTAKTTVTVNNLPIVKANASKKSICFGDQVTLTGTGATTYTWDNSVVENTAFAPTSTKKYTVTGTDNNTCKSTDTVTVRVNSLPIVGAISSNDTICEADSRTLSIANSKSSSIYSWSLTGTGVNPNKGSGQTLAFTAGTGNVTVSVSEKDVNGCNSANPSTTTIPVDLKPTKATTSSLIVCAKDIVASKGNLPTIGKGKWVVDVTNTTSGYTIDNLNLYNSNVSKPLNTQAGDKLTATWEISNGVCQKSSSNTPMVIQFVPIQNPTVTLKADTNLICSGDSVILRAKGTNTGSTPTYTLFDANGIQKMVVTPPTLADTTNVIFTLTNVTSSLVGYYVELTTSKTCVTLSNGKSNTINVQVDEQPSVANITEEKETLCVNELELHNDAIASGTGVWSKKTGDNGAIVSTSSTTAKASGFAVASTSTFYLTINSKYGTCPSTIDSVKITRSGSIQTPVVKSQSKPVCVSELLLNSPKLNKIPTPNTSAIPTETGTWTAIAPAAINDATGQTSNLSVGINQFVYTISNGLCPAATDTVTIFVVPTAVAEILLPVQVSNSDIPPSKSITTRFSNAWISAKQPAIGYKGSWKITNGASTTGLKGADLNALSDSVLLKNYEDKTTATWTVADIGNVCAPVSATVEITRKNFTVARAGLDTTVCISNLPYTRSGNDFTAGDETVTWSLVSSIPTGATVSQSGKTATFNATTAGVYEFEYKIYNSILDTTTTDTFVLNVDAKPETPVLTLASPLNICVEKLNLPAQPAGPSPTAIGTWKFDATQAITTQQIDSPNDATSQLSNIPSASLTKLYWVVQNGVCPKDSVPLTINQVGTLTPATISLNGTLIKGTDTSLCLASINTILGSTPSNDPAKGETGTWASSGTSISILGGNNVSQAMTLNSTGDTQISWIINNTDPNCTPSTKTVTFKVHDIPVLDPIVGSASLCEETNGNYSVPLKAGSGINTLAVTSYAWIAIPNTPSNTGSATLIGSGSTSTSAFLFKSNALTGDVDKATISVTAKNSCGTSLAQKKEIDIQLKPRDFVGSITGSNVVCESATLSETYTVNAQTNTTKYLWTFDNDSLLSIQPMLSSDIPSSKIVAMKPSAVIKVMLANACGKGVSQTLSVAVTSAVPVDANITGKEIICLPSDILTYQGSSSNGGVGATYAFDIVHADITLGKSQSASTTSTFDTQVGDLKHGDKIKLTVTGDPLNGCFSGNGQGTDELTIEGFDNPEDSIYVSKDSICHGTGDIELSVKSTFNPNNKKNDNGDIKWYYVHNGIDSLLTDFNGRYSFSISDPTQSGMYRVEMQGSICPYVAKDDQIVKIYEMPQIKVLQDPMIVVYQDGKNVPMPILVEGISVDTIKYVNWSPDTWLNSADSLYAKFVPQREQKELDYSLTIRTGKGTIVCETQANVKVINTLPLNIPNAFSPNGDGVNDTWIIQGLSKYTNATVSVFNRWGSRVFYTNDAYTPWDGNVNGIAVSSGTYYMILELKGSPDNSDQNVTKALTIVR